MFPENRGGIPPKKPLRLEGEFSPASQDGDLLAGGGGACCVLLGVIWCRSVLEEPLTRVLPVHQAHGKDLEYRAPPSPIASGVAPGGSGGGGGGSANGTGRDGMG